MSFLAELDKDGSHTINNDLYINNYTDLIKQYKKIFKTVFIRMGHKSHYKMMMRKAQNCL